MDSIERQIDIDATAEKVWGLVSEPGWFINDGAIVEHRIEEVSEGVHEVHDPTHGKFRIRTEKLDPPHYAAFLWIGGEMDQHIEERSTLVEFRIDERPGGVTLRVVESGFSKLSLTEEAKRQQFAENSKGWEVELAAAKAHVEEGGR